MKKNRNYACKDVDMLLVAQTIVGSFKSNITELSEVRTDWTPAYVAELETRIKQTIDTYLGVDAQKGLREATATLAAIQAPAKRDVSFLKTQIDDDFKKVPVKRDEILKTLGFTDFIAKIQQKNQDALIQLLYKFKQNLTDPIRQEIVDKGTNPTLIDRILGYADVFMAANVTQETFKSSAKEVTQESVGMFNAIYDEVIGICKKAAAYYIDQPLKKEQFLFANVLSKMGGGRKGTNNKPETPEE